MTTNRGEIERSKKGRGLLAEDGAHEGFVVDVAIAVREEKKTCVSEMPR